MRSPALSPKPRPPHRSCRNPLPNTHDMITGRPRSRDRGSFLLKQPVMAATASPCCIGWGASGAGLGGIWGRVGRWKGTWTGISGNATHHAGSLSGDHLISACQRASLVLHSCNHVYSLSGLQCEVQSESFKLKDLCANDIVEVALLLYLPCYMCPRAKVDYSSL